MSDALIRWLTLGAKNLKVGGVRLPLRWSRVRPLDAGRP